MEPLEDDRLQRYFDGDLDEAEAEEVRRALDVSENDRARLAALEHLHGLLADETLQPRLDGSEASALFDRIEASLGSSKEAGDETAPRPALRVVDGGGDSEATVPVEGAPLESGRPYRPEAWRIAVPAAVALAAAAALALFLARDSEAPPNGDFVAEQNLRPHVEDPSLTVVEPPHGSEVVEVDFGDNAGTVFEVEGSAGEPIAVVWIADGAWDAELDEPSLREAVQ